MPDKRMSDDEALALQAALNALFAEYGLSVGVGITGQGVAIRSQDERLDAINIGIVAAWTGEITMPRDERQIASDAIDAFARAIRDFEPNGHLSAVTIEGLRSPHSGVAGYLKRRALLALAMTGEDHDA